MGDHYVSVCEYGTRHSQCRCPSKDKAVKRIECPSPRACAKRTDVPLGQPYEPKHRKETPPAVATTGDAWFDTNGNMFTYDGVAWVPATP